MKLCGTIPVTAPASTRWSTAARRRHEVAVTCEDTIRAPVLYRARSSRGRRVAATSPTTAKWTPSSEAAWGLRHGARPPQQILGELFRILALTGPTLVPSTSSMRSWRRHKRHGDGAGGLVGHVARRAHGAAGADAPRASSSSPATRDLAALIHPGGKHSRRRFTVTQLRGALPAPTSRPTSCGCGSTPATRSPGRSRLQQLDVTRTSVARLPPRATAASSGSPASARHVDDLDSTSASCDPGVDGQQVQQEVDPRGRWGALAESTPGPAGSRPAGVTPAAAPPGPERGLPARRRRSVRASVVIDEPSPLNVDLLLEYLGCGPAVVRP
jgi:hypothetical protein